MKILLLDNAWSQTAALVKELYGAGFQVTLMSPEEPSENDLGKYCRQICSLNLVNGKPPVEYTKQLLTLLSREYFDYILPVSEILQDLAWDLPMPYRKAVFPDASQHQRDLLSDRRAMYALMESVGVPFPKNLKVESEAAIQKIAAQLQYPFVLRGTQGTGGQQVQIVDSHGSAISAYQRLRELSPQPPFAQQYIDGEIVGVGALLTEGVALQTFAYRVLETYPSPTGPSLRIESLYDPILIKHANAVFTALQWSGIAQAQFMRDKNGAYYFLEVNPRPWGSVLGAGSVGINLFRDFANKMAGKPVAKIKKFKSGIQATLFPAFINARISQGNLFAVADAKAYYQMLKALPWDCLPLLRHHLKKTYWHYMGMRRTKALREVNSKQSARRTHV